MSKHRTAINAIPWVLLFLSWMLFLHTEWLGTILRSSQSLSYFNAFRPEGLSELMDKRERSVLFQFDNEELFESSIRILNQYGLIIREKDENKGYILAEHLRNWFDVSPEEIIAIYFVPEEAKKTYVSIYTMPIGSRSDRAIIWTPLLYSHLSIRFGCKMPNNLAGKLTVPKSIGIMKCE